MTSFLELVAIDTPIVQAPMAGVSTPEMAAAVSNAGGLGSLGVGAMSATNAREAIRAFRARSTRSLNVNVFCHTRARADRAREARWIERFRPEIEAFGAEPPPALREIYRSFVDDDEMLAMLLEEKPKVVSFHFGLPGPARIRALADAGIVLLATATSLAEAQMLADAGIDAIIAQGYEAGGHRGVFDPEAADARLGTVVLTRLLARSLDRPVIAAGGIMDGAGIAAALRLGASAAQLGTAFIDCAESSADPAHRAALTAGPGQHTFVTRAISGRPARSLGSRWSSVEETDVPDYPIAYDLGKALHGAARAKGEHGYGAYLAGQGAPLARSMPAAALVATLRRELEAG